MKKYLTIVAAAIMLLAGAPLSAQTAQENLDKAKASLSDAQKNYDRVSKNANKKIDASKDAISDLKLKIDKDNLSINETNALIKQKKQTLSLKKDAYKAEKKALSSDGGLTKAEKLQLKDRESECKAIQADIKNDEHTIKTLKASISDKKNAIKREQDQINRSKADINAAKKELSVAKQNVKNGKKAVSAEKKAAAAEAKVAAAEAKAAKEAEKKASAELAAAQADKAAAEAERQAAASQLAIAQAQAEPQPQAEAPADIIAPAFANADVQLRQLISECEEGDTVRIPMTLNEDGSIKFVQPKHWVSGFFAGSLWYMYEYTGDEFWAEHAKKHTEILSDIQYFTNHHDVGFMINDSYGQGLRLKGTEEYKQVVVNTAKSLCTRFHPAAGIIQSWGASEKLDRKCPVIIDNMMNLELLFNATQISGDSTFYKIAVSHADKTIQNHYRPDYSTWHVVDYDPETGEVRHKKTAQGYSDDSSWSRGQSWGLYGYIMSYRYTGYQRYLEQAEHIAAFLMNHPRLPEDGVPYWDYDAPDIPNAPRDAAAGAIMASALYELYTFTNKDEYKAMADKIVASLSSPAYTAAQGTNHGFILLHSVTAFPNNADVDKPLNYTDYYYLEALLRKKAIEQK